MDHREFSRRGGQSKSPKKLAAIKRNCKMPRFSKRAMLAHLECRKNALEEEFGVTKHGSMVMLTDHEAGQRGEVCSLIDAIENNRIKR